MKKKIFIIFIILIMLAGIITFFIFFNKKSVRNLKIGNNSSSQEIVDAILNISSYETLVEVEVNSNKNKNKYILKQEYKSQNEEIQEVIEPSNIKGVKITKKDGKLKLENTNLNLSTIFENYEYVSDNCLDLSSFINDYKEDEKAYWKEENNQIVMCTKNERNEKMLYIDKTTQKPSKLKIIWTNKKEKIYILYNEVNINT